MAVPFRDLTSDDPAGLIGYLRFVEEPDANGIRAALFCVNSRAEPVDFSFTRVDARDSFLWRAGEVRRQAVTALAKSLFQATPRAPDLIIAIADEVPPRVFTEDLQVQVPVCRIAGPGDVVHASDESHEQVGDAIHLFWVGNPPTAESTARRLLEVFSKRQLLTEPFERMLLGIEEVFRQA